jgi:hypothetical protein
MLYIELKRAFRNRRFYISLIVGLLIAMIHFVTFTYVLIDKDLRGDREYPLSLFQEYLGGDPFVPYASILYLVLPLIIALPHSGSDRFDINNGYVHNIFTRSSKTKYYISKTLATFISGGVVAIMPLLINFMATAMFVPALTPQVALSQDTIGDTSFMGNLYFTNPLMYTIIYFIIIFIFFGLLSVFGLFASLFTDKVLIATMSPLLLYLGVYSILNALQDIEFTSWNPAFVFQPSQFIPAKGYIILTECLLLLGCAVAYVVTSVKKERVV